MAKLANLGTLARSRMIKISSANNFSILARSRMINISSANIAHKKTS